MIGIFKNCLEKRILISVDDVSIFKWPALRNHKPVLLQIFYFNLFFAFWIKQKMFYLHQVHETLELKRIYVVSSILII